MPSVLVTGANGFIGRPLVLALAGRGFAVRQAVRRRSRFQESSGGIHIIGDIGPATDWDSALDRVDVVIHLAARVHFHHDDALVPNNEYRITNVLGTERLARCTATSGAHRLVYLSSIGVNGRQNAGRAFTEQNKPSPYDTYTSSKWEAEKTLRNVADETGLETVILRPPLVYGPGNPGNFLRLLELVSSGWPLPLEKVNNRRSLIYVGNLVDAIMACIERPAAAGKTFLVSDDEDVSTPELIRRIACALGGKPARLFPCPPVLLRMAAQLTGKQEEAERLLGSLAVDSSKIRRELGWKPPYTMEQGLKETVRWFQERGGHA